MIIASVYFCGCSIFYFSPFLFFFILSPRVCYKPNTNFMTAIPNRFHPITIVGHPFFDIDFRTGIE